LRKAHKDVSVNLCNNMVSWWNSIQDDDEVLTTSTTSGIYSEYFTRNRST
jgi:hypothetical protein